jgi:outer membrane protein OmpA-like peptidoglycan-associated protein
VRKPLAIVVAVATALSGPSLAQRQPPPETEALAHIFSAFMTQADAGLLSEDVRLGPELAQLLGLAPGADRTKVYEALVDLAGEKFDVRKATPAEVADYGARRGLDPQRELPLYTLEAGARRFLIQYDSRLKNAVFVGQLGLPDPEIRPVIAKVEPVVASQSAAPATAVQHVQAAGVQPTAAIVQTAATGMTASARKPEAPPQPVTLTWTGHFEFDQPALAPQARDAIDEEILPKLKQLAEIRYVLVNGHADRMGPADYNRRLSEARAAAVRAHLIASGVDPDKIEIFGYGKTMPVKACPAERERDALVACLAPNRRVMVEIQGIPLTL